VVVPYVGGGYGTKSYTKVEPLAALGAWVTRRPVRVALSVEEAILTTRSDSARIRARSAFRSDGTLLAREFDVVMNSGAYTDNSPLVCAKLANRCFGPYKIPAVRVRVRSAFTNTVSASSLRGFGAPQGNLAGELQMDEAADRLGIDARELRLRNVAGPGEELLPGKRGLDADLAEARSAGRTHRQDAGSASASPPPTPVRIRRPWRWSASTRTARRLRLSAQPSSGRAAAPC
jgi:CO/xanthine dehydrogenase Mo-binding subunit